jgi:hypothetical protein
MLVAAVKQPNASVAWVVIGADSGTVRVKPRGEFGGSSVRWSPDSKTFTTLANLSDLYVWDAATGAHRRLVSLARLPAYGSPPPAWSPDGQVLARATDAQIDLTDPDGWPLGVLLPGDHFGRLAVTADGHYRGSSRVERKIRMVVQKRDGSSETLTPREFEQKYGFKNDPEKVRLKK